MRREVFYSRSRQLVGRRPCSPGEDLMGEIAAGVQVGEKRVGGTGGSGGLCGKDGWGREGEYFENPEGSGIDLDMSPSKSPYPLSD